MRNRPYTTRAQHALALADASAEQVGTEYVGTEHLLIGLLEEGTGPAAQLLNHLGVTTENVRAAWQQQTGRAL
ncbi:MAG: Clp protease N-terminal domain-containing protein [Gemmatimonadota bacterium]